MLWTNQRGTIKTGHLAAVFLAILAVSILAAGCSGGSTVSNGDIEHYCATTGADTPTLPFSVAFCAQLMRRQRDAANTVGCGAEFDSYFKCIRPTCPLCANACDTRYDAIERCGLRNDPDSACTLANARLAACGLAPRFVPIETGLCDGLVQERCMGRCIAGADCVTLQQFMNHGPGETSLVDQCANDCIIFFLDGLPSSDFDPGFP
jgi:hypothetical protein